MERAASDRLSAAAASSVAAASAAGEAHDSVFDEVLALVAARARRDSLAATTWAGRKPYRALAPYGPEDADLFVGRERLVAELAARVLDRRLVAVVGASGSGKSSIVRAGLDPLVRSGRLPGGEPWRSHVMVPGTDPIGTLLGIEQIDEPGPQLLIVDQFEEIAASGAADGVRRAAARSRARRGARRPCRLVVRADQYGTLALSRPPGRADRGRPSAGRATERGRAAADRHRAGQADRVHGRAGARVSSSSQTSRARTAPCHWPRPRWPRSGSAESATSSPPRSTSRSADSPRPSSGSANGHSTMPPTTCVRDLLLRLVDVTDDGQWVRRRIADR